MLRGLAYMGDYQSDEHLAPPLPLSLRYQSIDPDGSVGGISRAFSGDLGGEVAEFPRAPCWIAAPSEGLGSFRPKSEPLPR